MAITKICTWTDVVNAIGLKSSAELKDGRYDHEPGLAVLISIHALPLQGDSCNGLIVWNMCRGMQTDQLLIIRSRVTHASWEFRSSTFTLTINSSGTGFHQSRT